MKILSRGARNSSRYRTTAARLSPGIAPDSAMAAQAASHTVPCRVTLGDSGMHHVSVILAMWALGGATDANSLGQLIERMAQMDRARVKSLARYTNTRRYILNNKRFKTHAEMTVHMLYDSSGRKEFHVVSESGSPWVRKFVFRRLMQAEQENARGAARRDTRVSPDNYEFHLAGTETANGRLCYLLDAAPKTRNKYLFRGRVWVDAEDAAVVRIEGSPAQLPSFWTTSVHFVHQYQKVGSYWMAS